MQALPPVAVRTVALAYIASIAGVAIAATTAAVAFGDDFERWRDVPFPQLPRTVDEAGSIALHNGRILLGAIGAALAVNAPWLTSAGGAVTTSRRWKLARTLCDVVLALGIARNLITVGVGLAAYRERMVLAIVPHGPAELAAFSCGLGLYLLARRGPVERRVWLTLPGAGGVLLVVAAVLEVFVVF